MKKSLALLGAALLLGTLTQPATASPTIGQPAPAFSGTDAQGRTVALSDFKGKIVVLEWTSSECPIVKKHYDSNNMQKLQKLAMAQGVV